MPGSIPRQTVRRSLLTTKKIPDCLSTLDGVCSAGAQSPEVQGSVPAQHALGDLTQAVATARASMNARISLAQALLTAIKTLDTDFKAAKVALRTYESIVDGLAGGAGAVINRAGLLSRDARPASAPLDKVTAIRTKPGKHAMEAIVSWSPAPGATSYVIDASFTAPGAPVSWAPLTTGSSRRRVVKGQTLGAQLLLRIAALGSDGTQSEWSDPVLVTTA